MTYGARADVPMGEFWTRHVRDVVQSAPRPLRSAHVYGKPIVQAEAFTSARRRALAGAPGSLKALGDWAFCEGINRFVFHRYAHQPWLDRWPGMTMGPYGIHYERTQTWWDQSDGLDRRTWRAASSCCSRGFRGRRLLPGARGLAAGLPGAGVRPRAATRRLARATTSTAAPRRRADTRMTVKDGRIVLPDGMSYRLLVLPRTPTMTPRLLGKVKELVEAGATAVGTRPLRRPV